MNNLKTAICSIAKCENNYLLEWVEYHLQLGFTHIYIYDNNDLDGERIDDVLGNYSSKCVFIIDCRGKKSYQTTAYNEFYKLHGNNYDWIAFIDVDEFITFSEKSSFKNINEYLNSIHGFDIVHINWMNYGDNDIIEYNSNAVLGRFTKPLPFEKSIQYECPENNHVKSILRGGINEVFFENPHTPEGEFEICDGKKNRLLNNSYLKEYNFDEIYIRHFTTKILYEWIKKVSRGLADRNSTSELYSVERFFLYNKETKIKRKIVDDYLFWCEIAESQVKTELSALKNDIILLNAKIQKLENKNKLLNQDIQIIKLSLEYKLALILLKPKNLIKKIFNLKSK